MIEDSKSKESLVALFFERVQQSGSQIALKTKENNTWYDITWNDYGREVERIAKGLLHWTEPGESICLLSENCVEWVYTDFAIQSLHCCTVPIYPTTVLQDIEVILNEVEAKVIFVSTIEQLQKILHLRRDGRLQYLEKIVCFELSIHCDGETIVSLEQLKKRERKVSTSEYLERQQQITEKSTATIIYTSGTTGVPKGAILTHGNLLANLSGLHRFLSEANIRQATLLSFLPLSHAFERMMGHFLPVKMGFQVAHAESFEQLSENLQEIQPDFFVSVPSFYEQLYERIIAKAKASPVVGPILDWCLKVGEDKTKYIVSGREPGFYFQAQYEIADRILFRHVRQSLGGNMKWAISGGAPLAKNIADFLLGAGIAIVEGYGLSETGPVLTSNPPWAIRPGSVGKPLVNVELKLVPEPGYDRHGEGEIYAKGPNVMQGYLKKSKETKAVITDDGWLKTGDIGYFDQDGYLFISDRKKELIKTINGKYVAPQPIENRLKVHPLIQQAVVVGERRSYCTLLVVPNSKVLESSLELPQLAPNDALYQKKVRDLLQEAIDDVNLSLSRWEQIREFSILPRPLSLERGELTPTMKVKRRVVDSHFKEIIDAMYTKESDTEKGSLSERRKSGKKG